MYVEFYLLFILKIFLGKNKNHEISSWPTIQRSRLNFYILLTKLTDSIAPRLPWTALFIWGAGLIGPGMILRPVDAGATEKPQVALYARAIFSLLIWPTNF
jgi:hypothetical protein